MNDWDMIDGELHIFSDPETQDDVEHYGTPRHSGRYPWGSGDNPYQHELNFQKTVAKLKDQGLDEKTIAKSLGMNTSQLRSRLSKAKHVVREHDQAMAVSLIDKGMTQRAAAERMGLSLSSFQNLINPTLNERNSKIRTNANALKEVVDRKGYVDVGAGSEAQLGVTKYTLKRAVDLLQDEGYVYFNNIKVRQVSTGYDTTLKVLAKPGTDWKEVYANRNDIGMISDLYSEDQGKTLQPIEPPVSVNSKRVQVVYAEQGGKEKDGLIELRRGVDDISLGNAQYAQVRIAVDGSHYLKGMAVYSDDLPDGVDIRFNTNKHEGTPMLGPKDNTVLKPMKLNDPENPFGASIKGEEKLRLAQRHYIDENGERQLSALNIVSEEGTWSDWGRTLPSQFLGKQPPALAKQQLDVKTKIAKSEYDEILAIENPVIRADQLNQFAGKCERDATRMAAAPLPGQSTNVILPVPSLKETEIYAPQYKDGTTLALVRFPHGGIFEIPVVTVNNKNEEAKSRMGTSPTDAVGINAKTAEQLSGADFDGDTVLCIPCDNLNLRTKSYFEELKTFDPKETYSKKEGMTVMRKDMVQKEMGSVSNLITDMTVKGAPTEDIIRAVKHSMVVIDAYKHELDFKQSEIDNGIAELKEKWQGGARRGASTLLSRATATVPTEQFEEKSLSRMTPDEKKRYYEGELIYEKTGATYSKKVTDKDGNVTGYEKKPMLSKPSKMSTVDDAYELVSGTKDTTTRIESVYADYANGMKAMAKEARKLARDPELIASAKYDPSAGAIYKEEVASLRAKVMQAEANSPLERRAQGIANVLTKQLYLENPGITKEDAGKLKDKILKRARDSVGAHKKYVDISDREWEAIQHRAVSPTLLRSVVRNAKPERIKELSMPKSSNGISSAKLSRAKAMLAKGYSQAEVADMLGIARSTLMYNINEDKAGA